MDTENTTNAKFNLQSKLNALIGMDSYEQLNFLQEYGFISDMCVTWNDVVEEDAARAIEDENKLRDKAKDWHVWHKQTEMQNRKDIPW